MRFVCVAVTKSLNNLNHIRIYILYILCICTCGVIAKRSIPHLFIYYCIDIDKFYIQGRETNLVNLLNMYVTLCCVTSCLGDVKGGGRDRYSCSRKSHVACLRCDPTALCRDCRSELPSAYVHCVIARTHLVVCMGWKMSTSPNCKHIYF
jgi:hypothetical protein